MQPGNVIVSLRPDNKFKNFESFKLEGKVNPGIIPLAMIMVFMSPFFICTMPIWTYVPVMATAMPYSTPTKQLPCQFLEKKNILRKVHRTSNEKLADLSNLECV